LEYEDIFWPGKRTKECFILFSNSQNAKNACSVLEGMNFFGNKLECCMQMSQDNSKEVSYPTAPVEVMHLHGNTLRFWI